VTFRGNISPPCKWELKLTETSKGKRKSHWHNSRAVKEDTLKVMHCNILVCGVLICMASIIDSVILGPWIKCKLSLYRHDIKDFTDSHPQYYDCSRKFAVEVKAKSIFWLEDWVSLRAGLQQGLEETVSLC